MAEEDYEIDFYGDSGNEQPPPARRQRREDSARTDDSRDYHENERENGADAHHDDDSRHDHESDPQHQYRDYRSSERDDEGIDPGATTALMVSELNWWTTDDDIRGWLRQGDCEDGIKDMTFSEHKVNGKSKGQTYIEFYTQKEASGAKRLIDKMPGDGGHLGQKKITTQYWNPTMNPFRTLPKDAPARGKDAARPTPTGPYNDRGNYNERNSYNERGNYGGGFRGRGGFSGGRGNMGQNNFNRNYGNNNNNMGYNNMGGGGGGFGNQNGNAGGNFGFGARGGMMGGGMRGNPGGMRGGRGGMMGMNPMGGMPMGMPGNMGMGMMGNGMQGFQGMGNNFNGGFGGFQNQGDWGNPHGAKRPRPE